MKNITLFLFTSIFSLIGAFAHATEAAPTTGRVIIAPRSCPTVASIKFGGLSTNTVFVSGKWFVGRRQMYYGTRELWTFIMGPIDATDSHDAVMKGQAALASLTVLFGPNLNGLHVYECVYNTLQGYPAVTMTPPLTPS